MKNNFCNKSDVIPIAIYSQQFTLNGHQILHFNTETSKLQLNCSITNSLKFSCPCGIRLTLKLLKFYKKKFTFAHARKF